MDDDGVVKIVLDDKITPIKSEVVRETMREFIVFCIITQD